MSALNGDLMIDVVRACMQTTTVDVNLFARLLLIGREMSGAVWDVISRCRRVTQKCDGTFVLHWAPAPGTVVGAHMLLNMERPLARLMCLFAVAYTREIVFHGHDQEFDADFMAAIVANKKLQSVTFTNTSPMFSLLRLRGVAQITTTSNELQHLGHGHVDVLTLEHADLQQFHQFRGSVTSLVINYLDYLDEPVMFPQYDAFRSLKHLTVLQAPDQKACREVLRISQDLRSASFHFEMFSRNCGLPLDLATIECAVFAFIDELHDATVPEITVLCTFWTPSSFLSDLQLLQDSLGGIWNLEEQNFNHVAHGVLQVSPKTQLNVQIYVSKFDD